MIPPTASTRPIAPEARPMPSPWLYIISLYFPFGLMGASLMGALPGTLFKLLEFSNQQIGMLGGLGLVASLRFVFAPWLDGAATKRGLSIATLWLSGLVGFAMAGITASNLSPGIFLWSMVAGIFAMVILNASHETAADGYYIRALDPKMQAQFIGVKTAAIRIGGITAATGLLLFATRLAANRGAIDITSVDKSGFHFGFAAAFALAGGVLIAFAVYNKFMVPRIPQDQPVRHGRFALLEVLREYFRQPKVALIILFILLYRFGEGFLAMKGPFYLDARRAGGLECQPGDLAFVSLLAEAPWMIVGGLLGGYIIKWFGLRRVLVPLMLCMNIPNLLFVWLAVAQPQATVLLLGHTLNIALLFSSSIEALGYGVSFSAMFYYMHIMATESGRNKTSILAVSFALMNAGMTIPAMMSGFVQAGIGYPGLFVVSSTVGLLALLLVPYLPMPRAERSRQR
jgi:MFS transporter, PAT family, beta-lactamase induction signal transducer AmpG